MTTNELEFKNYFRNESVSLVEVLENDETSWFFTTNNKDLAAFHCSNEMVENVNGNDINVRTFDEGELRFDDYFGKLVVEGKDSELVLKSSVVEIPTDLREEVERILH